MKPVILVTHKPEPEQDGFGLGKLYAVRSNYCRAILRAGGIPILTLSDEAQAYAQLADGVLFTGGRQDVLPSLYGEENRFALGCDPELDALEIALFHAFYQQKKPIFGICRGVQLINVALGGSLVQDIPRQIPQRSAHAGESIGNIPMHTVNALPGSVFHRLFGPVLKTNSHHHQAVKLCAAGMVASCSTDDGVIEAIEHESLPIFGTQWHPERQIGEENHDLTNMLGLFTHFVDLCKK